MDEESLFRDIHRHLLHRAKEADAVDTEATLAERFNVSRYRVRRVLDKLAQLGVVARAQFHAAVLKLHAALHREIIESCGNRILTAYALALLGFIEKLFAEQAHFDHELVSRLVSGNARLVTALKAEDIAAARESLKEVLEAEAEAVLEAERRLAAEEAGAASS